jgi:hypothetical protein
VCTAPCACHHRQGQPVVLLMGAYLVTVGGMYKSGQLDSLEVQSDGMSGAGSRCHRSTV